MRMLFLSMMVAGAGLAMPVAAAQIVLDPTAVIGNKGWFGAAFTAGNILNNQTGPISTETFFSGEYWLNGNNGQADNGPVDAWITIDLGQQYALGYFELYNTSNGAIGDRGTGEFTIRASNALFFDVAHGLNLNTPTVVASGTLMAAQPSGPRVAQTFAALSQDSFRYIQFRPTGTAAVNPLGGSFENFYGLNELRVFAAPGDVGPAVPEPATWGLLIAGFGIVGAAARRRRVSAVS